MSLEVSAINFSLFCFTTTTTVKKSLKMFVYDKIQIKKKTLKNKYNFYLISDMINLVMELQLSATVCIRNTTLCFNTQLDIYLTKFSPSTF